MTKLAILIIKIYQKFSALFLPKTCRFYPSCSSYAREALHKHGLARGALLSLIRIGRCSPLSPGGYDPVK